MRFSLVRLVLVAALLVHGSAVSNAFAQETDAVEAGAGNTGAGNLSRPEGAPDFLIRLTRADCLEVLKYSGDADYEPPAGVSYEPGVDVRGNSVTPADLSGSTAIAERLTDEIAFDLAINPLAFAGNPDLAEKLSESRLSLGEITIDRRTGTVRLDGEVLSRRPPEELIDACRGALGLTE